jgi:hypothetical protein
MNPIAFATRIVITVGTGSVVLGGAPALVLAICVGAGVWELCRRVSTNVNVNVNVNVDH